MHILVLLTQDFNLAATTAFVDPFRAANYLEGEPIFSWQFATLDGGSCMASNGMSLNTEKMPTVDAKFDLVVVSSSWAPERFFQPRLMAFLQRMASNGSTLAGIDTGAFVLAKAGLLKGRKATVHYEHIDAMIEMFPKVEVCEDLFILDDNRLTCCGGHAATDLALHILQQHKGSRVANAAARYIFHQSLRPQGAQQNPGLIDPLGNTVPAPVRQAITTMEQHLETPLSIPDICAQVGMSQRQMDRLFKTYVGKTPSLYYRDIRLDRARGLVTQTDLPIAAISVASGFAGQAQFTRAYRQRFNIKPSADRIEGRIPFEYRAWPMHRRPTAHADIEQNAD